VDCDGMDKEEIIQRLETIEAARAHVRKNKEEEQVFILRCLEAGICVRCGGRRNHTVSSEIMCDNCYMKKYGRKPDEVSGRGACFYILCAVAFLAIAVYMGWL